MNEFERKIYLKYRNIENMTQLLCLKLSIKTSRLHKKNLSNQLSNSSTNFSLGIKQPEF